MRGMGRMETEEKKQNKKATLTRKGVGNTGRRIGAILLLILSFVLSGCGKGTEEFEEDAISPLRVPLVMKIEQRDFPMIQEAFSRLVKEKLGLAAELVFVDTNLKKNVVRMYRKEGQGFDIISSQLIGEDMYNKGDLLPLDDLLPEYGDGILQLYLPEELEGSREEGKIFSLPGREDTAEGTCVLMRKDLLSETGIQVEEHMSLAQVEKIWSAVAELHPEMKIVAPEGLHLSFLYRYTPWISLAGKAIVAMDYGRSKKAEVLYETDTYQEMVSSFYRWRQKGWVPDYIGPVPSTTLVDSGELFSYLVHDKPGIEFQEGILCGHEMVPVRLTEAFQRYDSEHSPQGWAITRDCSRTEEAMELLNFLYTDEGVMNLLMYGLEGVHYTLDEEGKISFLPDSGYITGIGWALPNQYLCYRQPGEYDDLWGEIQRNNVEAIRGAALGFTFLSEGYEEKLENISQVIGVYADGLERGELDPQVYLPEFLEKLKEAGIQEVLEAVEEQYQLWLMEGEAS